MSDLYKNILIIIAPSPKRDGKPSHLMITRLRKAIQLSKKNNYSRIIFSGGPGKRTPPASDIMKVMSMNYIEQKKVLVDRNSQDLLHNAVFCWELIRKHRPKKITILTNQFEKKRAKYIFRSTYRHLHVSLNFETCHDNVDFVEGSYLRMREFFLFLKLKIGGIR